MADSLSTTGDSLESCSLNDSDPVATSAELTKADVGTASFPCSSAYPVFTSVVAPRTAVATTIPFMKPRLVNPLTEAASSRTSATIVSST